MKNAAFDKVSVSPFLLPLWSINTHCLKKLVTSLLALLGLATACERLNYENADVRTAAEYEEGHIQGAINIDVKQENFIETAKATLPSDKIIAVYRRGGRRSVTAAEKLVAENYKVINLDGGIMDWKDAGMPITFL